MAEHLPSKQDVVGSSPIARSSQVKPDAGISTPYRVAENTEFLWTVQRNPRNRTCPAQNPPRRTAFTPDPTAYTTVDGRQIQLGAANSPESRAAFDRVLAEWYANGRKLPQASSAAKDAPRVSPTVAMFLERFWTHAETYYRQPVLEGNGTPLVNAAGSQIMVPGTELDNYRQTILIARRFYADIQASNFACPDLEAVREVMIREKIDPETGSLDVAQVVLGHKSSKMTELYAEADVVAAHEVVERIG
jgi:hypothetical protein